MSEEISMDDHQHLLHRLHRLERAVQHAIDSVSRGELRPISPAEAKSHADRYGEGAWVLDDFVITDRNAPRRSALADSSDFDALRPPSSSQ